MPAAPPHVLRRDPLSLRHVWPIDRGPAADDRDDPILLRRLRPAGAPDCGGERVYYVVDFDGHRVAAADAQGRVRRTYLWLRRRFVAAVDGAIGGRLARELSSRRVERAGGDRRA